MSTQTFFLKLEVTPQANAFRVTPRINRVMAMCKRVLVFSVLFAMAPTLHADAVTFAYTQIDVPGEVQTATIGINNAGQIVGVDAGRFSVHAVAFLDGVGVFTNINLPGAAGGANADGINNLGQIVGFYNKSSGRTATRRGSTVSFFRAAYSPPSTSPAPRHIGCRYSFRDQR
jgi:hypothetical protein